MGRGVAANLRAGGRKRLLAFGPAVVLDAAVEAHAAEPQGQPLDQGLEPQALTGQGVADGEGGAQKTGTGSTVGEENKQDEPEEETKDESKEESKDESKEEPKSDQQDPSKPTKENSEEKDTQSPDQSDKVSIAAG